MMTIPPTKGATPPNPTAGPPPSTTFGPLTATPGELAAWLDGCERALEHPSAVEERLQRAGWHPTRIPPVVLQYRRRFNEHSLGYSALLVTTGVSALAAGTAGHLLATGLSGPVNRNALAAWLTAAVCAAPFAVWAHRWAARVDRDDPVAAWSRSRRVLALLLVWGAGVVGGVRLITYVAQLLGVLLGASWAAGASVPEGVVNVAITVVIALPLGLWAFGFLHRFDPEDPGVPEAQRRRTGR